MKIFNITIIFIIFYAFILTCESCIHDYLFLEKI